MHPSKTYLFWVTSWVVGTAACADAGSCRFSTPHGYDFCEDFLGAEYNQSVTQFTCSSNAGTWSKDSCPATDTLGTCAIQVAEDSAQNVLLTYYQNDDPVAPAPTSLTAKTACGLAGGVFAMPH